MAKVYQLTRSELNKIKQEAYDKGSKHGIYYATGLNIAFMLENGVIDHNEEQIINILKGIDDYVREIKDHKVTMNEVAKVLEKTIGYNFMTGEIVKEGEDDKN